MTTPDDAPWPPPREAWGTVAVLLVVYVAAFADRQILALLVQPIRADLHVSDTQVGLLTGTAFALFYTLLGLPFGRLADRRSRRGLIAIGAAAWSVMTLAGAFTRSFAQLFLARVGVGVGEASLGPAAFSWLGDLFPPERRARAFAVYGLGIYLGAGIAFGLGGLVVGLVTARPVATLPLLGEIASWKAVFALFGLPGLLLLPPLILSRREPARRGDTTAYDVAAAVAWMRARWRLLVPFCVGFGLLVLAGFALLAWAPELFRSHFGWSPRAAGGSIGLAMAGAGSLGVLAGGVFTDWLIARGRRDAVLIAGALSAAAGIAPNLFFPFAATPTQALASLCLIFFAGAFASGAAPSALTAIAPNALRGQVTALYLLVINLMGLGLGPVLPALLSDRLYGGEGLGAGVAIVTASACAGAAVLLAAARRPFRAQLISR